MDMAEVPAQHMAVELARRMVVAPEWRTFVVLDSIGYTFLACLGVLYFSNC
jgi:hypothetical protein